MSNVFTLYAVANGTTGTIKQIIDQRVDPRIQRLVESGDSDVEPTFVATVRQEPRVRFTTTDIKGALDLCGISGLAIPSGGGGDQLLDLWFAKRTVGDAFASGSVHTRVRVNAGLLVPRPMNVSIGQRASIEYELIAISADGDAAPFVIEKNQALPSLTTGVTGAWTVGPWYLNGVLIDDEGTPTNSPVTGFGFDPGITVNTPGGKVYPTIAYIASRNPTLSMTTLDVDQVASATIPIVGEARSSATRGFLRALVAGGAIAADNVASHIMFDVTGGQIAVDSLSAVHQGEAGAGVVVTPIKVSGSAIVIINTARVIDGA